MTGSSEIPPMQPLDSWSSCIDAHLASALEVCNVKLEPIDPAAVRLRAVPLPTHFSKPRTNLLIHQAGDQVRAYVDIDLTYNGPKHAVRAALNGPSDHHWRKLSVSITVGDVGQVVRATLGLLGSPVTNLLHADLVDAHEPMARDGPLDPNSVLATETRAVAAGELAMAFQSSVHKPLAQQIAAALTRRPVRGCVVWGPSGSGKGHLLHATAHILLHRDCVRHVRYLPAARLTCGRASSAERDRMLATLLDELVDRPLLLLLDHLDLGISGTMASLSLLGEALDRGARVLSAVQDEDFLRPIQEIPWLARRLLPVRVPSLDPSETLKVLKHLVRTRGSDVAPAALLAAIEITQRQGATQPAAAIDRLSAALAQAHWRPHKSITPDDVTSALVPDWPR